MKKDFLKHLFDAMYHGKYDFKDFISVDVHSCFETFEADNRQIHRPNRKLKAYHSFLNLFLFEFLQVNINVVFSYRKGFNAYSAVSKHASNKYFYQTDFTDFFQSLNSELIKQTILNSAKECPILDIEAHVDRIIELVTVNKVMPMGYSTSPLISNACLFEFDNRLEAICTQKDLTYTRYSDDIIISSKKKNNIVGIEEVLKSILKKSLGNDISVNQDKSRLSSTAGKIRLLGMTILPNGKVSLDAKFRSKIEVHLHYYSSNKEKFLELVNDDNKAGLEKISGWINYASTVDPSYLDKLRKKYGATIVDMFIHKSAK